MKISSFTFISTFLECKNKLTNIKIDNFQRNTENIGFKVVDTSSQLEDNELCHVSGIRSLGFATNSGFEQVILS